MKKLLLIAGIGLLVLIIIVSIVIGLYLGPIVKIGMEQVGPKVTQVPIKVDSVSVSLLSGSAGIKGLVVGNPAGYKQPQAISVGTIDVRLDPGSVMSNKIIIHSVQVKSPEITFEGGLSGNNLSKILSNVNADANNGSKAENQASNKPVQKIEVDDFLITGAKVHVNLSGLVNQSISLPDIHLTNLGKNNSGLTPSELTSAVLKALSIDVVETITSSLGSLGNSVKSLGSTLTGSLGSLLGKS